MAIRRPTVDQVPVRQAPVAAKAEGPSVSDVVAAWLKDNRFSQSEAKKLAADMKTATPEQRAAFAKEFQAQIDAKAQKGIKVDISDIAAVEVARTLGEDVSKLFFHRQQQSAVIDREVNQGLEKTAATVENTHDTAAHRQASDTRSDMQKAIRDSHRAEALPKDRTDIHAQKATAIVLDEVKARASGKIHEIADKSPAASAMLPHVEHLAKRTVEQMALDPELAASAASFAAKVGSDGLKVALEGSSKGIGQAFLRATNLPLVNHGAAEVAYRAAATMAQKLPQTALTARIAEQATVQAASMGAKAAGAAAQGTRALPVIGNVIAVGTAFMAGSQLVMQAFKKPHDLRKIANEGAYFATQLAGIFIPVVGLGGSLAKIGTDSALRARDEKKAANGEAVTENASFSDLTKHLPFLSSTSELLEQTLRGAGQEGAAEAVSRVRKSADHLATLDNISPEQLGELQAHQKTAMTAVYDTLSGRMGEIAADEKSKDPASVNHAMAYLMGKGFNMLGGALKKHGVLEKNLTKPFSDQMGDVEAKRTAHANETMQGVGAFTAANAMAQSA